MNNRSTSPTFSELSSRAISRTMEKRSWNATKSLERMLSGRSRPVLFPTISPSLPELPVLMPMTFEELASSPDTSTSSDGGLFSQLIGDPRELLHDLLDRPEHYERELLPILLELLARRRGLGDLTQQERALLDRSTAIYAERSQHSPSSTDSGQSLSRFQSPPPEDEDDGDGEEDELPWGRGESGPSIDLSSYDATAPTFDFSLPDEESVEGWWRKP